MLRTIRRWFSTDETKRLGQDVDRALGKVADLGITLESLQLRVERQLNRLQMRDSRDARRGTPEGGLSDEELRIVEDLRRNPGGGNGGIDQGWPG